MKAVVLGSGAAWAMDKFPESAMLDEPGSVPAWIVAVLGPFRKSRPISVANGRPVVVSSAANQAPAYPQLRKANVAVAPVLPPMQELAAPNVGLLALLVRSKLKPSQSTVKNENESVIDES
jgi:hypothetical protein